MEIVKYRILLLKMSTYKNDKYYPVRFTGQNK